MNKYTKCKTSKMTNNHLGGECTVLAWDGDGWQEIGQMLIVKGCVHTRRRTVEVEVFGMVGMAEDETITERVWTLAGKTWYGDKPEQTPQQAKQAALNAALAFANAHV